MNPSRNLASATVMAPARAFLLGLAAAVSLAMAEPAVAQPLESCHVGAYRLADGQIVDVGASVGALRWRRFDGESGKLTATPDGWKNSVGWTERPDDREISFGACSAGTIRFGDAPGRRIPLQTLETDFVSRGARLSGRLVLPPGGGKVPIVVLLHGSERHSARDFDALQRLLPAAGVGAFVYDKRGTGSSEGTYTQDYDLLADDAVAALEAARKLAGDRSGRFGFQGPSQGGWVAPIAAGRTSVDFVIVSFGLAVSVLEEDQEAVAFQMSLKGHDAAAIEKALAISRAAGTVWESGFTKGIEVFDALRVQYRDEPWFKDVYGNFTHVLLGLSRDELRQAGPQFRWGTPFRYDPRPVLAALPTPQLWILGGQDIDAPSGETVRRLEKLIAKGRPITLALYPRAEHGMTEFETTADGNRVSTRYADGYFRMMRDFARDGCLRPPYGDAGFTPRETRCARQR